MADDVNSIKTWGKKVRYLGSAHSGVRAARTMHVTSIALIPLTVGFVWILLALLRRRNFDEVRDLLGQPLPMIVMLLFVGVGIAHMKIGMQSIIDDYVHDHHLKNWALIANTFFAWVVGLASIYSLLRIGLSPAS